MILPIINLKILRIYKEQMETKTLTRKFIKLVAERRMVKYIQFIELTMFLLSGYILNIDFIVSAIFFILGIFFALIAGESALLEHDLKKVKDGLA